MSAGNDTRRPSIGRALAIRCEQARPMMMAHIDGELGPSDTQLLEDHLAVCVECSREEREFRVLGDVTEEMLNEDIDTFDIDDAWETIYARLERSAGWLLLSAGLIVLLLYGAWVLMTGFFLDSEVPLLVRFGVGATIGGVIVLLVSIGREVLFKRKSERYDKVKR